MNAPTELTSLSSPTSAVNTQFHVRSGYVLEANAWAAKDAKLTPPTINTYTSDDRQRCGWYAKVNEPAPYFVQAYPEVLTLDSTKPWSELPQNPLGLLPRQINGLTELSLDFSFLWEANEAANVAIEMWLMRKRDGVGEQAIAAEVMVWLDKRGSIRPAGKEVVSAKDSPIGAALWMSPGFGAGPPWPYFAIVPPEPMFDEKVDLLAILQYLVRRGSITGDLWVRTLEIGTEIIDGDLWFLLNKIEARMS